MDQTEILQWLESFSQQPQWVYPAVILLLFASSFGLPIPEEITLITAGMLTYLSMSSSNPQLDPVTMSIVCFVAVFGSDALVYFLGRLLGPKITRIKIFSGIFESIAWKKVDQWAQKYGHWTAGIFRFTPGIRFPGHFWCGMSGIPFWKFTAIDGTAALLTVPTQVLLIAYYGDWILQHLHTFKFSLLGVLGFVAIVVITYRIIVRTKKVPA